MNYPVVFPDFCWGSEGILRSIVGPTSVAASETWGVPYFRVLTIRILLFRVLYWGPLFSETPL